MRVADVIPVHGVLVADFTTVCHNFGPSFDAVTFPPMVTWRSARCKPGKGVGQVEKQTEWGQTVVNDDVLAVIAARSALTVPGVVQTSQRGISDNLGSLVRHDVVGRGVRIAPLADGHYAVEIHLVVAYGHRLAVVGRQVAQEVNQALKDAIGLYPDQLAIHVDGIRVIDQ